MLLFLLYIRLRKCQCLFQEYYHFYSGDGFRWGFVDIMEGVPIPPPTHRLVRHILALMPGRRS